MSKIIDNVVEHILRKREKEGLITSEFQKQSEKEKLTSILSSNEVQLIPNPQSGKTDIIKINDDLENIELDLMISFEKLNALFERLDSHKKLNGSLINNMRTNIAVLNDKVMSLSDTVDKLSNNIVYVESFRNVDSFELDRSLYTAENGDTAPESYHALFDKVNECIRMPKSLSVNKLIAQNGQRMCAVKINKQLGGGLITMRNPNNTIDKCIDTSLDTYWEETILADTPIKVKLDPVKYYGHYFGALCELEVIFNSIIEINEIELHPFGSYPMEVKAIKYYTTDDPDKEENTILSSLGSLSTIEIVGHSSDNKSLSFDKPTSIQFEAVAAKRLRILFNQQHYIRNTFIYDKKDVRKNNMWFDANAKVSFKKTNYQQGVYDLKAKTHPSWGIFNQRTKPLYQNRALDIKEFLFPSKTELKQTTKYEYNYGLYHMSINENSYKDVGIYVSKPIKIDQNIGSISLGVDEYIPSESYNINYYVSFADKPGTDDWTRIYPNASISLKTMLDSEELNFKMGKERYFGSNGSVITLEHTPYINYGIEDNSSIYLSITKDGDIISEGTGIENVTNYVSPVDSYKNFNKDTDVIQYYFYKNKIYFNNPIPSDCAIDIEYKHFVDSVRLKAVLKRTSDGSTSLSAVLNQYSITFKPIT